MRAPAVPGRAAHPARAARWTAAITASVTASSSPKRTQHLVEHDVVEHLDAPPRREPRRRTARRARAAAVDQLGHAVAAERAQGRVDREAAGPARELRHPVDAVAARLGAGAGRRRATPMARAVRPRRRATNARPQS